MGAKPGIKRNMFGVSPERLQKTRVPTNRENVSRTSCHARLLLLQGAVVRYFPSPPCASLIFRCLESERQSGFITRLALSLVPTLTAGFLSGAGAETPLNFREKFRVFPRTILENFSGVDTQTAVLVSTAEVWISAPDTQTPIFLGFLGIHS